MARYYRAQVELPYDDGASGSKSVNVWHFESDDVETEANDADAIADRLVDAYEIIGASVGYWSANLTSDIRVKVYNLEDEEPRVALQDRLDFLPGVGGSVMPNEVALCASFRSNFASGQNRRRTRGRVYLGPWSTDGLVDSVGDARPSAGLRTAVINMLDHLLEWTAGLGGYRLSIFSRADAGNPAGGNGAYTAAQLVNAFHRAEVTWVDDSWDTQRRRGLASTTRTTGGI